MKKPNHNLKNNQTGALAIIIIIGTATIALILMLSANKIMINLSQTSRSFEQTAFAFFAAESCLEESLLQLKKDPNYQSFYTKTNPLNIKGSNCWAKILPSGEKHGKLFATGQHGDKIRTIGADYSIVDLSGSLDDPKPAVVLTAWQEL